MTVAISNTQRILRKRFGAYLRDRRSDLGMTQADVAALVHFDHPAMVSQIERGASVMPTHELDVWADALRVDKPSFAKKWVYFSQPDVYECLYGEDPYEVEEVPRSPRTIKSAPGRPPLRRVETTE